jgi:SpoVK/Ycf46/Vps4 family AAA+-type ATPase
MNSLTPIKDMLRAYYPIIYVTTFEYTKTIQQIQNIIRETSYNYSVYHWNLVEGLSKSSISESNKVSKIDNMEEPTEILQFIELQSKVDTMEVYILEDFHDYMEEKEVKIRLRKLAEKLRFFHKHIIIVSPILTLPIELEKYVTVVNSELPNREELQIVLDNVLASCDKRIDENLKKKLIDSALGMTVMEADLAFCLAAVKSSFDENAPAIISKEKEQIIKKSGLLDYIKADEDMQVIGGMNNLKSWLEKRRLAYDFKAQLWHLSEPKGILLLGVPGCGKSLTAKCISSYWNMPLLRLDIGKVFHGIVGSSEENIRRAIMTAEAIAPCVLWIDEIEKGLSGVQSSGITDGGTTSRIFSTILTWMQEKRRPVFVVATANNISLLPPELLRKGRFDEIFFVDLPTEEERKTIFEIHLKKRGQDPHNLAMDRLAKETDGFNGAEIEECIKEAMFSAYIENINEPKLMIKHLLDAISTTVPLSVTMKEQISRLRDWAKTRAKNASEEVNVQNLKEIPVLLTLPELELERSFDLTIPKETREVMTNN